MEFVPKFNLKSIKNDRDLRKIRLKLDCPSELEWERWKPGHEHHKTFYIKNILNKVQTLRWEEPDTPYFNTSFQESHAKLNPGMTAAIIVFFRPENVEEYFSSIVFRTARGSFTLHLRGLLPSVDLGLPTRIDFKYCPVKDVLTKKFDIHNDQDFIVGYKWAASHPFSITPVQGNLKPGQVATMSCHFCPDNATAYKGLANVGTTTKSKGQIKLFGIGKYSFLALSRPVLEFGDVLTRTSKEMELIVTNISPVIARFTIKRVDAWYHGHDCVFSVQPMDGAIPPNSALALKVSYHPIVAGTFSLEQFEMFTSQARRASFACSGTATRPIIRFTVPFMDFGSVESGSSSHRTITVDNQSASSVAFQFVTDEVRLFEFMQPRGVCRANRSILFHCHFRPLETMNYYKRVLVILQDQYPLFVDVIGTCYKVALRSPTLLPYHIYEHRENLKLIIAEREMVAMLKADVPELSTYETEEGAGEGPIYPDPIDVLYGHPTENVPAAGPEEWTTGNWFTTVGVVGEGEQAKLPDGAGRSSGALANMLLTAAPFEHRAFPVFDNWDVKMKESNVLVMENRHEATGGISALECWEEYFLGRMVDWDPVTVDQTFLDFGVRESMVESPVQLVYVKNNLADPVTCMWMAPWEAEQPHVASIRAKYVVSKLPPPKIKPEPEPLRTVFHVEPEMVVIPSGLSFPFSVTFTPSQDEMYYYQLLSCFVWTKTSYHVLPNWSTTVQVTGHTFREKSHMFMPLASLSTHKVVFPPAVQGTRAYQSILMYNHDANTPLRYVFTSEHLPPEFSMKPSHGLIPPKDFNMISFRYEAGEPKLSVGHVVCTLNNSATDTLQVNLTASSHIPKVRLERKEAICFKPTSVGTQATQTILIMNVSAVPAYFEWQVPPKFAKIFIIEPSHGLIRAGERKMIEFFFFPQFEKLYYCQISCLYAACVEKVFVQESTHLIEEVTSKDVSRIMLVVNGEGIVQTIQISPGKLEYGIVNTGFPYKQKFSLVNPSVGSLRFLLELHPGNIPLSTDSYHCVFDCYRGILAGGMTKVILVTFHPLKAQAYDYKIICKTFFPPVAESFEESTLRTLAEAGGHVTLPDETDSAVESKASCTLSMSAIHPSVILASVRTLGLSAPQFFRARLLRHLNRELTDGKIKLRAGGKVVQQELFCMGAPIQDGPQDFPLHFGVRELGSKSSVILLALKSGTTLGVAWRIRLWNDIEVDTENWVIEGEPSESEERLLRMRPLFQVEPRKGHLEPGETSFVLLTYRHSVEGFHMFPAILEVTSGRTVHMYLSGGTLLNPLKSLVYRPDTQFLKSTVVGEVNPPLQTTELCNTGNLEMVYNVDMVPLVRMQENNYGFRVMWCLNPTGVIPPMESVLLNWLFQPLEAKTYSVELPVNIEEGKGGLLILQGVGLLPTDPHDPDSRDGEPPRIPGTTYNWPGVPAILSTELLEFGTICELSLTHRLVAIQNVLDETRVAFWWRNSVAADHMVDGQFSVEPQRGVLDAGKRCMCKISFTAGVHPQLFETTLYCELRVLLEDPASSLGGMSVSEETKSEIIVDTWPKSLGWGPYNRNFIHKSALTLSTVSSRSKVTDFAMKKSAANTYLHYFERLDHLEPTTPPNTTFMLYMTVVSHVVIKHYHPTKEDLLSSEEGLPWRPQERSELEIQTEFVNGILLEILQESLHDECNEADFSTLDTERILEFEEFQKEHPTPLTVEEKLSQMFESLGDGELPPPPLRPVRQETPEKPCPSFAFDMGDTGEAPFSGFITAKGEDAEGRRAPRPSVLVKALQSSTPNKVEPQSNEPPDHSSMAALSETAELLLEEALFSLVQELFESD